ncbi:hypothetical protein NKH77_50595 [Streptomyces sp. M19]
MRPPYAAYCSTARPRPVRRSLAPVAVEPRQRGVGVGAAGAVAVRLRRGRRPAGRRPGHRLPRPAGPPPAGRRGPGMRLAGSERLESVSFRLPGVLLAMSRLPEHFLPELLGADLCLRAVGLPPPLGALVGRELDDDTARALDLGAVRPGWTESGLNLSTTAVRALLAERPRRRASGPGAGATRLRLGARRVVALVRGLADPGGAGPPPGLRDLAPDPYPGQARRRLPRRLRVGGPLARRLVPEPGRGPEAVPGRAGPQPAGPPGRPREVPW